MDVKAARAVLELRAVCEPNPRAFSVNHVPSLWILREILGFSEMWPGEEKGSPSLILGRCLLYLLWKYRLNAETFMFTNYPHQICGVFTKSS